MLIQLKGIEKTFKTRRDGKVLKVLNGIDLSIEKGEMVAIKGSSGAGKSTLLHILGCLDKPTSGTYTLDGADISIESAAGLASIRNKKFGFVMQHFALVEEDDALSNVAIPLLFGNTKFSLIDALAMERLRQLGIENLARQRVAKLSGGEKQRVAIARALVNQPEVILADEPTGALDKENSAMIMRIFKDLNAQGKTIIVVTHEEFVANSCDRIITISDGKIIC
jgi:putative ABC transport system ATP-binding protein